VPVLASLILAIPVAVHSSSVAVGERLKRWGLFLTPEETRPPKVLQELQRALEQGNLDATTSPPARAVPVIEPVSTLAGIGD